MVQGFIVPANTVAVSGGDSSPFDISAARDRVFLVVLEIASAVEQEAIEISLFGSRDGAAWSAKPIATLPQRYYPGTYPSLIDISADREITMLRAHWEPTRWGRGEQTPRFEFSLSIREVSPQDLQG